MCVFPESMSMYHLYACCLWKPEEGLDPLELELLMTVSRHVDAGNQNRVPGRAVRSLNH